MQEVPVMFADGEEVVPIEKAVGDCDRNFVTARATNVWYTARQGAGYGGPGITLSFTDGTTMNIVFASLSSINDGVIDEGVYINGRRISTPPQEVAFVSLGDLDEVAA